MFFGALLATANYGSDIGNRGLNKTEYTGFSVILIDIEKYMPIEAFKVRAAEYIEIMKSTKKQLALMRSSFPKK